VTAALKYPTADLASAPALLGVERSARFYRWVERLDPGRALAATAISQAHGLPELLGRVLAARGAEIGVPAPTHARMNDAVKRVERGEVKPSPQLIVGW